MISFGRICEADYKTRNYFFFIENTSKYLRQNKSDEIFETIRKVRLNIILE